MMQGLGKQRDLPSEEEDKLTHAEPENSYTNTRNATFLIRISRKWSLEEDWVNG